MNSETHLPYIDKRQGIGKVAKVYHKIVPFVSPEDRNQFACLMGLNGISYNFQQKFCNNTEMAKLFRIYAIPRFLHSIVP